MSFSELVKQISTEVEGKSNILIPHLYNYLVRVEKEERQKGFESFNPYHIRVSELVTLCPRRAILLWKVFPQMVECSPGVRIIFDIGSSVHILLQDYLKGLGILKEKELYLTKTFGKIRLGGHIDAVIELNNKTYLLEIKTTSDTNPKPSEDYQYQIQGYMLLSNIDRCILLYVHKSSTKNPLIEYFFRYNKDIQGEIMKRIEFYNTHIDVSPLPLRYCESITSLSARYCEVSNQCFNSLEEEKIIKAIKEFDDGRGQNYESANKEGNSITS